MIELIVIGAGIGFGARIGSAVFGAVFGHRHRAPLIQEVRLEFEPRLVDDDDPSRGTLR